MSSNTFTPMKLPLVLKTSDSVAVSFISTVYYGESSGLSADNKPVGLPNTLYTGETFAIKLAYFEKEWSASKVINPTEYTTQNTRMSIKSNLGGKDTKNKRFVDVISTNLNHSTRGR